MRRSNRVTRDLHRLPELLQEVLELDTRVKDLSKIFTYAKNFLYLGRGYNYPAALEGALKLKEISYIHAEGCPAAEMKHGTIALIDDDMPTVVNRSARQDLRQDGEQHQQIKARNGRIIALVTRGDEVAAKIADYVIEIPEVCECLSRSLRRCRCSCWPTTWPSTRAATSTSRAIWPSR